MMLRSLVGEAAEGAPDARILRTGANDWVTAGDCPPITIGPNKHAPLLERVIRFEYAGMYRDSKIILSGRLHHSMKMTFDDGGVAEFLVHRVSPDDAWNYLPGTIKLGREMLTWKPEAGRDRVTFWQGETLLLTAIAAWQDSEADTEFLLYWEHPRNDTRQEAVLTIAPLIVKKIATFYSRDRYHY